MAKKVTKSKSETRSKKKAAAKKPGSAMKVRLQGGRGGAAKRGASEIGSEAVQKATGRGWDEWFAILDSHRAQEMTHKDIAVLLHEKHGVAEWWCQMVTVAYERA